MAEDRHSNFRMMPWFVAGALSSPLLLGGVLYATFWLPFQPLHNALPRSVEILPLEQEPASAAQKIEKPDYGWVKRDAGLVRIPVEEAMNIVVQTLPVDEDAAGTASKREQRSIPTDAGAGRFVIYPDESSQ